MKKVLAFLFTFVLCLGLFGCAGSIANGEDYTIDKEIVIDKEITVEESKKAFDELEEGEEAKYVSCDFQLKQSFMGQSMTMNMNMILVTDGSLINGKMVATVASGATNISYNLYIKDNYFLLDLGAMGGKMKAEIPNGEEIDVDDLGGYDFAEIIEEFFEDADELSENVKTGYDSKGCLVLDYAQASRKARFVFDKAYPVYFYASEGEGQVFEMKFSYDKVDVEFPEDLKLDDYKTVSWDELQDQK